jgi:hypothetical protein
MSTTTAYALSILTDYTNATEATLATALAGASAGSAVIYNTDLVKTRIWDGAAFVDAPTISATPGANTVTNAMLVNVATATFKGRTTGGTGSPEDLTVTQATALLNVFGPDLGAGGVKGLVPATVAGDASKYLRGDGTWQTVAGAGDMVLASAQTNSGIKTFLDTTMKLRNVANTFDGYFVNTNTANRIYTLQDRAGTLIDSNDLAMTAGKTLSIIKTMSFTAADDTGVYTLPTGTKTLVATDVATLSSLTTIGTITSGGLGTGAVIAGVTMTLGSDASYDVYYRGATGVLTRLANGTTGQVLGATTGAAPSWISAGAGDMVLASVQTVTGAKTFDNTKLLLRNVGNTFNGSFVNTNTADRIYTLQDRAGTILDDTNQNIINGISLISQGGYN